MDANPRNKSQEDKKSAKTWKVVSSFRLRWSDGWARAPPGWAWGPPPTPSQTLTRAGPSTPPSRPCRRRQAGKRARPSEFFFWGGFWNSLTFRYLWNLGIPWCMPGLNYVYMYFNNAPNIKKCDARIEQVPSNALFYVSIYIFVLPTKVCFGLNFHLKFLGHRLK